MWIWAAQALGEAGFDGSVKVLSSAEIHTTTADHCVEGWIPLCWGVVICRDRMRLSLPACRKAEIGVIFSVYFETEDLS